jgi:hypothetical protein
MWLARLLLGTLGRESHERVRAEVGVSTEPRRDLRAVEQEGIRLLDERLEITPDRKLESNWS